MGTYQIREAHRQDLEGIYTVFLLADKLHRDAHPEIFQEPKNPNEVKDYLLSSIRAAEAVVFVAEVQGEIVGAILAWARQTSEISLLVERIYLSVENLVVADEYQGQGVGRALLAQMHLWAQARGIRHIELTVWDFNQSAIAFYEKLGYQMLHHRMRKELP